MVGLPRDERGRSEDVRGEQGYCFENPSIVGSVANLSDMVRDGILGKPPVKYAY